MATQQETNVTSSTSTFSFSNITNFYTASEIKVKHVAANGTTTDPVSTSNVDTTNKQVTLSSAVTDGTITVYRETNLTAEDIEFQAGSSIKAADLNKAQEVLRRGIEETREQGGGTGTTGATGATGPAGPQGPAGPTGATGPQGPAGAAGADGSDGATGATGPQGATGATGAAGADGSDGATGATGPQGPAGATGATGPAGAAGSDATVNATNVDSAGAIMNSDLDGKGEILIGDGSGDPTALAVGTNTHVLTADSNEASGVKWAAVSGGSSGLPSSPSVNQMLRYDGSEWVTIAAPSGTSGQVLAYSSSTFSWAHNLNVGTINLSGHLAEDTAAVADTPDGNGDVPLSLLSGSILTWTLGANRTATFTGGYFSAGRSALLMVACGSNTLTWPSNVLTWVGGSAPTLATSGYSCIEFWTQETNSTKIYACYVGDVA